MKFLNYSKPYLDDCLSLFDENCPEFFAENEREDYVDFLANRVSNNNVSNYYVGIQAGQVVAAFGVTIAAGGLRARLSWILVSKEFKGKGFGAQMMGFAKNVALEKKRMVIDIAASNLSAPFFAKFGARELSTIANGWGPGMHRVDMELKLT